MNEEEIFSIIERFLLKLKPFEWAITSDKGIRLTKFDEKILVTDAVKGRIAQELARD